MHIMTATFIVTIITNVMRNPLKNIDMFLLLLLEEFPSWAADVGPSGDDFDPLKNERIWTQRLSTVVITLLHLHNEYHTFFISGGISNQTSTFLSRL